VFRPITGYEKKETHAMAKFLALIYGDERRWESMSAQEQQRIDEGHRTFNEKAGPAVLFGAALDLKASPVTLRAGSSAGRRPTVTDGPFTEAKEVVGGFYLLEAPDFNAAVALAEQFPEVEFDHSGVEVRPLLGPN